MPKTLASRHRGRLYNKLVDEYVHNHHHHLFDRFADPRGPHYRTRGGGRPEARLIADFIEKIGQLRPQLITFNGHSFDLPVLRYRAMVNRISAVGLQVRPYFHRCTEDAFDLSDVLGSYVPGAKVKLDDVS